MKKVVFICLLSVSWCLSLPSGQQGLPAAPAPASNPPAPNPPVAAPGSPPASGLPAAPGTPAAPGSPAAPASTAAPADPKTGKPAKVPASNDTNNKVPIVPTNETQISTNTSQATPSANNAADTVKPKEDNKTTPDKKGEEHKEDNKADISPTVPPTANVTSSEKPKNGTKVPEVSTPKSTVTVKPTEDSKTPPHIIEAARGFDGASFIGGIILTLGLLAIGFMGFKYYRNQTERNYHTL